MDTFRRVAVNANALALLEAALAYGVLVAFTVLGRAIQPVFVLVMLTGIGFPLVWAALTRQWAAIGITRRHWKPAVWWGIGMGAGLASLLYIGLTMMGKRLPPGAPLWQILIGILFAFLVVSPFQEFFFRGWLQPRFERALGPWAGLVACSLCFACWDVIPLLNTSLTLTTVTASIERIPVSFSFGMLVGYAFQRTGNMLAPWLAHAIAVIALLMTGQLTLGPIT